MESFNVYRYRAIRVRYSEACQKHGVGARQTSGVFQEAFEFRETMSEEEQQIVDQDSNFRMILIEVDVSAYPGWPVRVWERGHPLSTFTSPLLSTTEWLDWDVAGYFLAQSLGLLQKNSTFINTKHIYWTGNPLGKNLDDILMHLVEAGVLEFREEPDRQFRRNADFKQLGDSE